MTPRRLEEIDAAIASGDPGEMATVAPELEGAAIMAPRPEILRRLGQCHRAAGDWARCAAALRLASALAPGDAGLKLALGDALAQGGATVVAMEAYDRAAALAPGSWEALFSRAQGRHLLCRMDEAIEGYDEALALSPGSRQPASFRIVALNYRELGQERILAESRTYGAALPPTGRAAGGGSPGKIRVGFLSPDLRTHSVTYFLAPILDRIPAGFEAVLYSDSLHSDATTDRLRALAGGFARVDGLGADALLSAIRADGVDVLIDLAGHFGRDRLPVLAARAAPTQVSYLGYPNTTGVPAVDWRVGDDGIDLFLGSVGHWTERLETMRSGMLAYEPPRDAPPSTRRPDGVVFGYFGHMGKISPDCAAAWARILAACPGSKLLARGDAMGDPAQRAYWETKLAGWGLDSSRVELRSKVDPRAAHLAMYGDVTVTLDTWPYNGTTTTCESLWMGAPVVTLQGARHASRVGAALLRGAGLGRYVAADADAYVQAALATASDPMRIDRADLSGATWLDHDAVAGEFWELMATLHGRAAR